jgi:hypothetical protein
VTTMFMISHFSCEYHVNDFGYHLHDFHLGVIFIMSMSFSGFLCEYHGHDFDIILAGFS